MKSKGSIAVMLVAMLLFSSCSVLEQMDEMQQLSKCEFELLNVENLTIAGVSMEGKQDFSDFSFGEAAQLTMALAGKEIPADFTVNLQATNPNDRRAAMNRLEWKALIDGNEVTQGVVEKRVEIAPNGGSSTIPVEVNVDVKKILTGESGKALMNLVANINGRGSQPSEVSMKLSPSIKVGQRMLQYPGYITVNNQVGK